MKLLFTFESDENATYKYYANIILDDQLLVDGKPCIFWFGDADNDVDGSPYWHDDPSGQSSTSLKLHGEYINGDVVPFIVVPPAIVNATKEIVLGCLAQMEYNGKTVPCVVADTGPRHKIGEASPAALRALGLPAPHNGNGGLDEQGILYRIWPGVPANLDGTQFQLQHA